jgi:hypothetical protein
VLHNKRESLETFAHPSSDGSAPSRAQPKATYLALYKAEIRRGNFAAASPWFDRYLESVCNEMLGIGTRESSPGRSGAVR